MDVALLVFLILLNALFAMSEMALTASRKARLQVMVEAGDSGAQAAMDLHDNPTKFLSVVQIGITSISILNGIVGDAAFSAPFAHWLRGHFNIGDRAAEISATAMVVVSITFLSIIFGELVPKRIGIQYPEVVARYVARPMEWLSLIARPFVRLLSWCTEGTLRLMGIRGGPDRGLGDDLGAEGQVVGDDTDDLVVVVVRLPGRPLLELLLLVELGLLVVLGFVIVGDELGLELLLVQGDLVLGLALGELLDPLFLLNELRVGLASVGRASVERSQSRQVSRRCRRRLPPPCGGEHCDMRHVPM